MKKIILSIITGLCVLVLPAQQVEQGNRALYYERYTTAGNIFSNILAQDPGNVAAWHGLTESMILQKRIGEAFGLLQNAPASIKNEPYFKVSLGSLLLQENKASEAAAYFKEALEKTRYKKSAILAAVAKAHINAKDGDYSYAIELLKKAAKRDKKDPATYVLMGDAYRKLSDGSGAYKAYQQAIHKNEQYAAAWYRLGEIFLSQNNTSLYVDYFKKAVAADPAYAPALYRLYVYEFSHNPVKAMDYYQAYVKHADDSDQRAYDLADLLYINKNYEQAINKAKEIIETEGEAVKPRMYKLIGYSLAALNDTAAATGYMKQFLLHENDSNVQAIDYDMMAVLYQAGQAVDSAIVYYQKALKVEKDSGSINDYYKKLANLSKEMNDYTAQAKWLGLYYSDNDKATNVDLFNWALAHYRDGNYVMSDSVFGMYTTKYPEQGYGYYWQAKSRALLDSNMDEGFAVPVYAKLIEVIQEDTANANYKKWLVESYGYLAAYEANTEKDYEQAMDYFGKLLEVDPDNTSARKYIAVLEKNIKNNQ